MAIWKEMTAIIKTANPKTKNLRKGCRKSERKKMKTSQKSSKVCKMHQLFHPGSNNAQDMPYKPIKAY